MSKNRFTFLGVDLSKSWIFLLKHCKDNFDKQKLCRKVMGRLSDIKERLKTSFEVKFWGEDVYILFQYVYIS